MSTLSKSRHKTGISCPRKLYYAARRNEYANQSIDDSFLQALADGGGQVGELAKCYFPGGNDIVTLNYEQAIEETNQCLEEDSAIVYEAAIRHENLFVRVDVLKKDRTFIDLIEVKAKSFSGSGEGSFLSKNEQSIISGWKEYLYDIAFQTYVAQKAFPQHTIRPYLMLVDKDAQASVDGLNAKFRILNDDGRTRIDVQGEVTPEALGDRILIQLNVGDIVRDILEDKFPLDRGMGFEVEVEYLSELCATGEKGMPCNKFSTCKNCDYRAKDGDLEQGMKCGFSECVSEFTDIPQAQLAAPSIFDVWSFTKHAMYEDRRKYFIKQIEQDELGGGKRSARQWLQIQKAVKQDSNPYVDGPGLKAEMDSWKYPLHFIDFETSTVAIPFTAGRHPYEVIAFQFSHHRVDADGTIAHVGQYLNAEPAVFPNFDFIRALKADLEHDDGTIFMYAIHENTVMRQVRKQLLRSDEPDKDELITWIETIATPSTGESWEAQRPMVDLQKLVKEYFYQLRMGGSNSIKQVLPAILNSSECLKAKYAEAIYGVAGGISSLNFSDHAWVSLDDRGDVIDPYKCLPQLFDDVDPDALDLFVADMGGIADGGAAMTAYAKMQFTDMTDAERASLKSGLLCYCELDTFAMVLIWEGWQDLCG